MIAVFVAFFLFIGLGFDFYYGAGLPLPIGTTIACLFGLISSYGSFYYGDKVILSSSHAQPLDTNDAVQKQWQNVVEEMSIAAGIPLPKTYWIDDPDPNAFATGRDPEHASIVVTKGLLGTLNRDELQGVAAHEMSHIKNLDIRLMLLLAVLVGAVALIADWTGRSMWRNSRRSRSESGSGAGLVLLVLWLVTVILAPLFSQMMALCVSRRREYLADATGAELTRNPLALASALEKIDASAGPTRSINQGTAHLCIADPKAHPLGASEGRVADLFATHPPIQRRIEALKKMAYTA